MAIGPRRDGKIGIRGEAGRPGAQQIIRTVEIKLQLWTCVEGFADAALPIQGRPGDLRLDDPQAVRSIEANKIENFGKRD